MGNTQGLIQRTLPEQHAKFISSQARQRIALAHPRSQDRSELAQQGISGGMATGVIDEFELIQVEITKRVSALVFLGMPQHQRSEERRVGKERRCGWRQWV